MGNWFSSKNDDRPTASGLSLSFPQDEDISRSDSTSWLEYFCSESESGSASGLALPANVFANPKGPNTGKNGVVPVVNRTPYATQGSSLPFGVSTACNCSRCTLKFQQNDHLVPSSSTSRPNRNKRSKSIDTEVLIFLRSVSSIPSNAFFSSLHNTFFLPERGFEFRTIKTYLSRGQEHNYGMELVRVARLIRENDFEFHINQPNAPTKFESNATTPFPVDPRFRMILWHGTKEDAIAPIIETGFILPQNRGQMFGNGIYFADRASKSANYCDGPKEPGSIGYLFLCDVMLGKHYRTFSADSSLTEPPFGYDSVKGMGKWRPDWADNELIKGSIVPVGRTIEDPRAAEFELYFNEYIVYDTSRVKIKYLVEIKYHKHAYYGRRKNSRQRQRQKDSRHKKC